MDLDFYKEGHLSQKTCQKLLDMTRHLHFAPKDIRSEHLLRRLELPCAETAMHTYDLWKEGDENQRLESVVRDNLEFFQGLMQSPKWKDIFDLMFREIFDAVDGRWIGPPSSAMWERIQKKLPPCAAFGATPLYFDETFQTLNQGIDTGSKASMNLGLGAQYQPSSPTPHTPTLLYRISFKGLCLRRYCAASSQPPPLHRTRSGQLGRRAGPDRRCVGGLHTPRHPTFPLSPRQLDATLPRASRRHSAGHTLGPAGPAGRRGRRAGRPRPVLH